ncbi:hypothetical protein DOTSEDRAFT_73642 [Dothistroma septosporum NZE10]|uniref:Uncharacterized protein n=1 Tax=Dothistroma septosporum (strain NZE10 / CBS 128990) TaxID=675120 RepID=N1PFB2_DOTSN|nr:hypothetical protein DOTSEDRAFT_73642 [Dothistroma septosporum NZE10]
MRPLPRLDSTIRCGRRLRTSSYTDSATGRPFDPFARPSNDDMMTATSIDMPSPEVYHGVIACATSPIKHTYILRWPHGSAGMCLLCLLHLMVEGFSQRLLKTLKPAGMGLLEV